MDRASIEIAARAALIPLKPAHSGTRAPYNMAFAAHRTQAGRSLPPYYLVYFLLVDLLGFENLGRFEKVAWSIPIDFNGRAFLIEHRKFGLGIFAEDLERDEPAAEEIAQRIRDAVTIAEPFFEWLADQAADGSALNVVNRSAELYERHKFYVRQYEAKRLEAEARKGEQVRTQHGSGYSVSYPAFGLRREAKWLALSAIEAFFSWTEHIFIHLAILNGRLLTGGDVKQAANANWYQKFDLALDRSDPATQFFFDELIIIRQQLRNFDAHGSFGKQREAFSFHSSVGAVRLRLPHQQDISSMRFGRGVEFVDHDAIELIQRFVAHLWSGPRTPAKIYIQESHLPIILSYASDGTFTKAMESDDSMNALCSYLNELQDRYTDMDF
jgi:hypothetical protein